LGRRKKEPPQAHRTKILSAASALFLEKGVAASTVDEIAREAGYSKATLYVYFANKDEIYFALVLAHMRRLSETIGDILGRKAGTAAAWTAQYLEICFAVQRLCAAYPMYFEGMIGPIRVDIAADETPQVYRDLYQLGLEMSSQLQGFLETGTALGLLRPDSRPEAVLLFFWSSLSGIVRMAEQKKSYYALLGLHSEEFLKWEFLTLLSACLGGRGELP